MTPGNERRLCLALLRSPPEDGPARTLLERVAPGRFLAYLCGQRVDQLWFRTALDLGWRDVLPAELAEGLEAARRTVAGVTILHHQAAGHAAGALDDAGVPYVFFKGFQLGEELYGDALLRPASDLDLLIAGAERETALAALRAAAFELAPEDGQPPYQVTLRGHHVDLDLHWHLWSPERSREPLGGHVLAGRRERDGKSFPGRDATLAILLLNPAVTDHVTSRLIHAVDLDRFLRRSEDLDVERAAALVERTGLRAAAWAMLSWTRQLLSTPVPAILERRLQPGPLRRRYLNAWLDRDPARLYRRHPLRVRAGFSLFLHDRPGDALRALGGVFRR